MARVERTDVSSAMTTNAFPIEGAVEHSVGMDAINFSFDTRNIVRDLSVALALATAPGPPLVMYDAPCAGRNPVAKGIIAGLMQKPC